MKRLKASNDVDFWFDDIANWKEKIKDLSESIERTKEFYDFNKSEENKKDFLSDLVKLNNACMAVHIACMNCINKLKEKDNERNE